MFNWLFRRKEERLIFAFREGRKRRWADPAYVLTRLEDVCPKYREYLSDIATAGEIKKLNMPPGPVLDAHIARIKTATAELVKASRLAFDVGPFDTRTKEGITDGETLGLLTAYLIYMGGLADLARPLSKSPPLEAASPGQSATRNEPESSTDGSRLATV